jgi:phosphoenolpyruvate carboxylase
VEHRKAAMMVVEVVRTEVDLDQLCRNSNNINNMVDSLVVVAVVTAIHPHQITTNPIIHSNSSSNSRVDM